MGFPYDPFTLAAALWGAPLHFCRDRNISISVECGALLQYVTFSSLYVDG